tara:strand:- start:753 stop:953 length:201 start_codon:yes stop_codon:yes gene_type:complete
LRVIKRFSDKREEYKVSDYEKFLIQYVSVTTARKIISELIEFKIAKVVKSKKDLRVKFLVINVSNI